MAKKPIITPISTGKYDPAAINANLERLADAFENTLSRDGSTPNQMEGDFDLNGNDILNIAEIDVYSLLIRGRDITEAILEDTPVTEPLKGGLPGQILQKFSDVEYDYGWSSVAGSGDMQRFVYDPNNKAADVFSMENMEEGLTKKILTSAEKTKLQGIEGGAQVNTVTAVAGKTGNVVIDSTDIQGVLSVGQGGTSGTTPVDARTNLGLEPYKAVLTSSQTWTKPLGYADNASVRILVWGGGGAGGGNTTDMDLGTGYGSGGGGGSCNEWFGVYADLPSSVACVVAAGGIPSNTTATRNGGNSNFGDLVYGYGGGGGGSAASGGKGGGIYTSAESADTTSYSNALGGAGAMAGRSPTTAAFLGKTLLGGAGGGNSAGTTTASRAGGISLRGGNGGAGGATGTAGSVPAGGGGAGNSYTNAGAGARGQIEIYIG